MTLHKAPISTRGFVLWYDKKVKKLSAIIASIAIFSLPVFAFAAVTYNRTPAGSTVSPPVTITVSVDSPLDFAVPNFESDTLVGYDYWNLSTNVGGSQVSSACVPSSTLSVDLTINSTPDTPNDPYVEGFSTNDCSGAPVGLYGFMEDDFTVNSPAAPSSAISIPTSTASTLTANVGDQIADPGTLLVIAVAVGIPLAFYVIELLIGLIPKPGKKQ